MCLSAHVLYLLSHGSFQTQRELQHFMRMHNQTCLPGPCSLLRLDAGANIFRICKLSTFLFLLQFLLLQLLHSVPLLLTGSSLSPAMLELTCGQ